MEQLYVDSTSVDKGGNYPLCWGEHYDQKGRMLKAVGSGAPAANKEGFKNLYNWMTINCQTDHYTVMDGYPAYVKDFDKTFPLKDEEFFTIKGLLNRVR